MVSGNYVQNMSNVDAYMSKRLNEHHMYLCYPDRVVGSHRHLERKF
jgi:hypothetical protein